MTTDDFEEWDSTDTDSVDTLTVWNSDGTALLTTEATIDYCYANIALELEPSIIIEGEEFTLGFVGAVSVFNVLSTETGEYVGTTFGKIIEAESTGENNEFIVTVPRNIGFSFSDDVPEGYAIGNAEYIIVLYENVEISTTIYKIQQIDIKQP